MSFRGGFGERDRATYGEGTTFTVTGVLSTSRNPRVATADFADRDVMVFFGAAGHDVAPFSPHPEEEETAFGPGSAFTVLRQGMVAGLHVTLVALQREGREVTSDVDDAARRAGAVLLNAKAQPTLGPARPERYRGPVGEPAG